jgi:hypothetical protein
MFIDDRQITEVIAASVVRHKSLYFDCHSEHSEESRLFKHIRPFKEFTLNERFF